MGQRYARIASEHPSTGLTAIVDLNLDLATRTASEFGGTAYQSVETALQESRADAIVVATSEDSHVEPCVLALEAGVAVLVEKPLSSTINAARKILDAADKSPAPLMMGHLLRFDGRYAALRNAVETGELGSPLTATARRLNTIGAQERLQGRSTLPVFLGVHDFDLLRWILRDEVVEVSATAREGHLRGLGYAVEDAVFATLRFARGTLALVELGWILPAGHPSGFDQRLEITGTEGWASVDGVFSGFSLASADRLRWPDTTIAPIIGGSVGGTLERSFSAFVDTILTQSPPPITGQDGLKALEIALAVQEAATTGRKLHLSSGKGG
jgi:myo-inositol 2-dehydrogenase/D-chiro-inositol 1-dehydrogenase